jgi:inner membrane protein
VDPVSQGLAGAVFAQLAGRSRNSRSTAPNSAPGLPDEQDRKSSIRAAAVIGAIAGMAPDLDIFIQSSTDPTLNLEFHRHFTHALLFAPIGASVIALLIWVVWRRLPFANIWLFAFTGWFSHGLLDTLTSYGTLLMWPLNNIRYSLDWVSIIDPLVTGPVLMMVAIAWFSRRKSWTVAALIWSLAYFSLGGYQNMRGLDIQTELAASRQHIPERGRVMPSIGNLLVWRSVYLADGQFHTDGIRIGLDGSIQVYPGGSAPEFPRSDAVFDPDGNNNLVAHDLARFVHFADHYVSLQARSANRIVLGDLRYGSPIQSITPLWGISVDLSQPNSRAVSRNFGGFSEEDRIDLWQLIKGEQCEQPDCFVLAP